MLQITPTQARAQMRHRAFHEKIAQRAAMLAKASASTVAAPAEVVKIEITEPEDEGDTSIDVIACNGQVVIIKEREVLEARLAWHRAIDEVRGPRITIAQVQNEVCRDYQISYVDLISQRRTASVVRPRQVAEFLCRRLTTFSLPEIGRKFGSRDHTTVINSIRKIERLMSTDEALRDRVRRIASNVGGNIA